MDTPNIDRLLADDDDFGGPTVVEPPLHLAEGTPLPVDRKPPQPRVEPRVIAAMAAAKPSSLVVSTVVKPTPIRQPMSKPVTEVEGRVVSGKPAFTAVENELSQAVPISRAPSPPAGIQEGSVEHDPSRPSKVHIDQLAIDPLIAGARELVARKRAQEEAETRKREQQAAEARERAIAEANARARKLNDLARADTPRELAERPATSDLERPGVAEGTQNLEGLKPRVAEGTKNLEGVKRRVVEGRASTIAYAGAPIEPASERAPTETSAPFESGPDILSSAARESSPDVETSAPLTSVRVSALAELADREFQAARESQVDDNFAGVLDNQLTAPRERFELDNQLTAPRERFELDNQLTAPRERFDIERPSSEGFTAPHERFDNQLTAPRERFETEGFTAPRERLGSDSSRDTDWLDHTPASTSERKQLSLGPKKVQTTRTAKVVRSTYRWLGIGALAIAVLVLVGYISITVFYMVGRSWLVPTTLSPTDEKVVALQAELAVQRAERQRIINALADGERTMTLDERTSLQASLARQDKIIANLSGSAHLKALADHAAVALVPQANVDSVKAGTPLYACRLEMFWCRKVGRVLDVLPGDIQFRHPHRDTQVRGRMIEIELSEPGAAGESVLFADGKPLGL